MTKNRTVIGHLLILWCMITVHAVGFADGEFEPWALRDHYNFGGEDVTFQLDPKRAEWRVVADRADSMVKAAYTEIELGDGTKIRLSKSNWITDGRDTFFDGFGSGLRFRSEFKPVDGLHVEYHLNRYDGLAFMMLIITLRNTGVEPISVRAIRHGVVEPGALARVGSGELFLNRSARRGVHSVLQGEGQVNLTGMRVEGSRNLFGLGLLQSGYMRSSIDLARNGSSLSGVIESVYMPAIRMMPGGTAESDPMWILLSAPDVESLRNVHAYSEGYVLKRGRETVYPRGWMTVPDGTSFESLVEAAKDWKAWSIEHALVPGGWQSGLSKDAMGMDELAKALKRAGMTPGLTVDPLRSSRAIRDVTLEAADGSHWLNLTNLEARVYGAKSLTQLSRWKYRFFVVAPTEMPEDILRALNITRSVADRVSFELMQAAAGGDPVLPSSGLVIGNDAAAWQAAADATVSNVPYNVLTGPVRLDVRGVEELSGGVLEAIGRFAGPIEFVGTPGKAMRRQFSDLMLVLDEE